MARVRNGRVLVVYTLGVLFLVNVLNFVDRQLPSILAQSIKIDLGLSDTQLGLLGGVAFAFVYATLGLPLARLADTWSAKWVLTGCLVIWSLLTSAGGLARNFVQLAASRVGVAAGEAGSTPSAHAMISATVPARRRGLAMGFFSLGAPVGLMCGLALGGWLNDLHSWRFAMIAVGLPGFAVALLCAFTVPAPQRMQTAPESADFFATARFLLRRKSYRHMCIGVTTFGIGLYAAFQFAPAFLIRTYGLTTATAGLALGLVSGLGGGVGALGGGWLGDVLGRRNPAFILMLPAAGFAIASPFYAATWLAPTAALSIAFYTVPNLVNTMYMPPTFGVAQSLAPPGMRAMASAILLFGLSLVGASVGPFVAGLLSDFLHDRFGAMSLRYALCFTSVTHAWAAVHFTIAARALPADLIAVQKPVPAAVAGPEEPERAMGEGA